MRLRAVLKRYHDEHVQYITTDYPKVFASAQRHLVRILGQKHTRTLNIKDIAHYKSERAKGHTDLLGRKYGAPSDATMRRELSIVISACNWGLSHKWLAVEDRPVVDLPPASPIKDNWLSKEEALRFICEAYKISPRLGLFVVLGLFTGSRPSRLRYLAWHRIDRKAGVIDFRPHDYKGDAATRKRYVRVRMMIELVPYVETAWRRKGEGAYWVLGNTQDLTYTFKQALANAGLDKRKITPNTMRHTWATWSAIDGVDLSMISRVLGSTIATVEKRYAHHHPSYQVAATQRRFFAGEGLEGAI